MGDQERLERKWGGLEPWMEDFGQGMERRGPDGVTWYDVVGRRIVHFGSNVPSFRIEINAR